MALLESPYARRVTLLPLPALEHSDPDPDRLLVAITYAVLCAAGFLVWVGVICALTLLI